MFRSLETTWDTSARRSWTTAASFTMQALGISFLLLIPLLTVQGPPLLHMLDRGELLSPPPAPAPAPPPGEQHPLRSSHPSVLPIIVAPMVIPNQIATRDDADVPAAPDPNTIGVPGGFGRAHPGIPGSVGDETAMSVARPPAPVPTRPLKVSHWAEGNLIYRVQPTYPPLARQARIQGAVQLRAIISKAGTIENLNVITGHAMLVGAAVDAVKQWRYRPYMLNGEPIEVETEITVNFTLGGS